MSRKKPNLAEKNRRQDEVVRMTKAGYTNEQIAECMGVTRGVITRDRMQRASELEGVNVYHHARQLPDAPPFDWLTPPPLIPKVRPAYQVYSPFPRVQQLLSWLTDQNIRARLPFSIDEATTARDGTWFTQGQVVLQDAISYLQGLLDIMQDENERRAARSSAARDDLAGTTYSGAMNSGGQPTPLPRPGIGVLPVRAFQILWAYDYAGVEFDDAAVEMIAEREGLRPERVRRAMREYLAQFSPQR